MSKSPWLEDAAKGATGQTYEIRTVADFLKVPEDRRRICLREFHAWLAIQESVTALMLAAGNSLGSPLSADSLEWHNDVFAWRDDGKATIGVEMLERTDD